MEIQEREKVRTITGFKVFLYRYTTLAAPHTPLLPTMMAATENEGMIHIAITCICSQPLVMYADLLRRCRHQKSTSTRNPEAWISWDSTSPVRYSVY